MLAKYSGRCAICPEPIRPGDSIASLGEDSSTWVHAACHPNMEVVAAALAEAPPAVRPAGQPRKRKPRQIPKAPMIAPAGAGSVYTDGACSGNPGPGGWAWAIDRDTWASGSEPVSTNQRPRRRGRLLQTVAGAPACPARRPRPGRVVLGRIHHDRAGADRDLGPAAVAWSRRSKPMDRRARAPRWPS
jgi:hypothetical protein